MQSKVIKSKSALREFIKNLPPQRVVLFVTRAKNYQKANIEILKTIIMLNKFSGIYITAGRPYSVISENLKNSGIDIEKIFFIDCVTRMYFAPKGVVLGKPGMEMTQECLYLSSPANLTELAVAISQAIGMVKEPKNKFIFVDSLSMLLVYNDENTIIKFIHFLTTKVKLFGLIGIIMVMEVGIKESLLSTMYELCDAIVEVKI